MDTCREIEIELVAFCSGELDPAAKAQVQTHLDHCSSCREELARESRLRESLGTLPRVCIPHDIEHGIRTATTTGNISGSSGRARTRLVPVLMMAAASLAVALLLPAIRPASTPSQAFSDQEIVAGRADVMYTLALTAKILDRTQKKAVIEVFADKLPNAIDESFKTIKPTNPGGNG